MLALIAVLVMAALAGIVSLVRSELSRPTTNRVHNAAVLQQAKEALIGYVAREVLDLSNPVPGRLPCPEAAGDAGKPSDEGIASGSCSAPTSIGRLPWRTLGIDKLVDASNEPLWYAVSPNWAGSGVGIINPGTPGQLSVDGIPDVVAVIIAPGAPVTAIPTPAQQTGAYKCEATVQVRNDRTHVPTGGNPDVRNYLECLNATLPPGDLLMGSTVVANDTNPVLNDQMVYITASELLNAIQGPVAERTQKTVAPLFNEFSTSWVSGGTILPTPVSDTFLPRFMPYAVPFVAPESPAADDLKNYCGSATGTTPREGLLPLARMTVDETEPCATKWAVPTWSGVTAGVTTSPCTVDATTGMVSCPFRYYTLRSLPLIGGTLFDLIGFLGGSLSSPATVSLSLTTSAPNAAHAFRKTLAASDFIFAADPPSDPHNVTSATFTQLPNPSTGAVDLAVQFRVGTTNLCVNGFSIINVVCSTLTTFGSVCNALFGSVYGGFLGNLICNDVLGAVLPMELKDSHDVTLRFPALSEPTVSGASLLNPAPSDPHYWFFQNQWYRYTYYAISPNASAAQTPNSHLTVNGFPSDFGGASDKRFVLAVMGPAVTGQVRGTGAAIDQYLEGQNASLDDGTFAYQVFASSGNDRIATCPFSAGGTPVCN